MGQRVRIGNALFDPLTGEIARPDGTARLEPQPAALLRLLAERAGELVPHEELRKEIWGDTHVDYRQSLHYGVRQIRLALGERSATASVVESVPRRGYRLRPPAGAPAETTNGRPGPASRRRFRWPVFLGLAMAILVGLVELDPRPNEHHRVAVELLTTLHDLVY